MNRGTHENAAMGNQGKQENENAAQIELLRQEIGRLKRAARRYEQLVQMTDRGCYQLMYWDTDRDNWYPVTLSDDALYAGVEKAMEGM